MQRRWLFEYINAQLVDEANKLVTENALRVKAEKEVLEDQKTMTEYQKKAVEDLEKRPDDRFLQKRVAAFESDKDVTENGRLTYQAERK